MASLGQLAHMNLMNVHINQVCEDYQGNLNVSDVKLGNTFPQIKRDLYENDNFYSGSVFPTKMFQIQLRVKEVV